MPELHTPWSAGIQSLGSPVVVVDPEATNPNTTARNVPNPSTTQIEQENEYLGVGAEELDDVLHGVNGRTCLQPPRHPTRSRVTSNAVASPRTQSTPLACKTRTGSK